METAPTPDEREDPRMADRIAELRAAHAGKATRVTAPLLELRSEPETADDDDRITIRGHAAVFDRLSEDLGGFRERIKRGAFTKALDNGDDVRLLINHDGLPLARTKSKTLELREDVRGLHVFADAAPTTAARDLRVLMQRGDVDQMSFGFTVADGGDEWHERDGEIIRTIRQVGQLFDVSVVTFPAYPQTSADARSQDSPSTNDPGIDVPAEELAPEPTGVMAEAGSDTTEPEGAPTGDLAAARARRNLGWRILQRVSGHVAESADLNPNNLKENTHDE